MAAKDKIEEAVEWYRADSPLYEELALLVESVVKEMLKQKKVNYHNITHRAKTVEARARRLKFFKLRMFLLKTLFVQRRVANHFGRNEDLCALSMLRKRKGATCS